MQEAIKAAPESPAKAMMGPGVQKEAGKTGTAGANSAAGKNAASAPVQGPPRKTSNTLSKSAKDRSYAPGTPEGKAQAKFAPQPKAKAGTGRAKVAADGAAKAPAATAPKAKAKPKYDKELNSLVASRKGLKKGTAEYNKVQNRINEKLGSSVRRREEKATVIAPKKKKATVAPKVNTALPAKPSAPAAKKPAAKKPAAQKNSPRVTQTANRATVVTKSNGVKKKETVNKNTGNKKVVVKDANTRTVTKTNKAGESTTKTTKRIGKGRIKGAIKDARLARLDKKATRQAAKAADKKSKGADKLSGLGKSPAKQTLPKGLYQSAKKDLRSKREVPVPTRKTPIGGPGTKGLSKETNEKIARLGVKAGRKASGKPNLVRTPAKKYKK